MLYPIIQSKDNRLIKQVVKLEQDSNYRKAMGQAVVYGLHLVQEAQKNGILTSVIIEKNSINKYQKLLTTLPKLNINLIPLALMKQINPLDTPSDILGLINLPQPIFNPLIYTEDCILLDQIQDPGNLGTILRVAKASGVKNILLSSNSVDIYNSKVLRASQGIQFGLSIFTQVNLIDFISKYQGKLIATMPNCLTSIYQLDLIKPIGWVFGNEGQGINDKLLSLIKCQAKIPMTAQVESLNLAMSATICLFEMLRQRLST